MRNIFGSTKNDEYISLKNNIAYLYFILGRASLHCNFSSVPKDGSDILRFSNRKTGSGS